MKIKIIGTLLTIASLVGCTSTEEPKKASTSQAVNTQVASGQPLTDEQIADLVSKTSFSAEQLREAAEKLGYRCTSQKATGSRIKKNVCTTKQYRDAKEEAAREYVKLIKSEIY